VVGSAAFRRAPEDRGLTLIELLITITILGLIAAPLSAAMIVYFQHTDDTTSRLSLSHDAQIASSYFAPGRAEHGYAANWTPDDFPAHPPRCTPTAPRRTRAGPIPRP